MVDREGGFTKDIETGETKPVYDVAMKWKNNNERNGEDRKLIRFSKEIMLLSYGNKS